MCFLLIMRTQTILKRAERKSEIVMFLFVVLWSALMTVVALAFELYGLLALLFFNGLAPVLRAFFYPKAIEELNEIFTPRGL